MSEELQPSEKLLLDAFLADLNGEYNKANENYAIYDLALACAKSPAMVAMKANAERWQFMIERLRDVQINPPICSVLEVRIAFTNNETGENNNRQLLNMVIDQLMKRQKEAPMPPIDLYKDVTQTPWKSDKYRQEVKRPKLSRTCKTPRCKKKAYADSFYCSDCRNGLVLNMLDQARKETARLDKLRQPQCQCCYCKAQGGVK